MESVTLLAIGCVVLMIIMAVATLGRRDNHPPQHRFDAPQDQYLPNNYAELANNDHYRPTINNYWGDAYRNPYDPYGPYQRRRPRETSGWFSLLVLLAVAGCLFAIFSNNSILTPKKDKSEEGTTTVPPSKSTIPPLPNRGQQKQGPDPFEPRYQGQSGSVLPQPSSRQMTYATVVGRYESETDARQTTSAVQDLSNDYRVLCKPIGEIYVVYIEHTTQTGAENTRYFLLENSTQLSNVLGANRPIVLPIG